MLNVSKLHENFKVRDGQIISHHNANAVSQALQSVIFQTSKVLHKYYTYAANLHLYMYSYSMPKHGLISRPTCMKQSCLST